MLVRILIRKQASYKATSCCTVASQFAEQQPIVEIIKMLYSSLQSIQKPDFHVVCKSVSIGL